MPKRILLIFGLSLVLLTVLVMYLLEGGGSENGSASNPAFESSNWEESYLVTDSNARGLSIFNELLEYRTKKRTAVIVDKLTEKMLDSNVSYLFVGTDFQLKTTEFDSILTQVEKGANLFLAFDAVSENIYSHFFVESEFDWDYSELQYIRFGDKKKPLKLCNVFQTDTVATVWNFFPFDSLLLDDNNRVERVTSISSANGYSNMLDVEIGKGHVYLHSNPHLFQNYQLLSENGYAYNKFMVDLIPEHHQVKWLELGRLDEENTRNATQNSGGQQDNSYLQFIFKHPALTIALLLAIFGIILYLIFRTKRSKPFIPYLPKTANHSLSFADTIKEIYFKQQTPYRMLQVMRKNFVVAVNKQFFIDLSKAEKEAEIKMLAEKSGLELKRIELLIRKFETRVETAVDYNYLQEASQMQQQFYRDTGIIKDKQFIRTQAKMRKMNRPMWIPLALIFAGIFSILFGFYQLFLANGFGIILWPVGMIMLILGIRMLMLPILKTDAEHITFYYLFGRKKKYHLQEITHVEMIGGITRFTTDDNRIHSINHNSISIYDRGAYQQFISPFIKDQL